MFTTKAILEESALPQDDLECTLMGAGESKLNFLRRIKEKVERNEVLLLNTWQQDYGVFNRVEWKIPVVLRVHNVNDLFRDESRWDFSLHTSWKLSLKRFLNGEAAQKKIFRNRVSQWMFPSTEIGEWTIGNKRLDQKRVFHPPIPFVFRERSFKKEVISEKPFKVVISGAVDPMRRDYEFAFEVFKQLKQQEVGPFQLVLLGEFRAASELGREVELMRSLGIEIIIFEKLVSQEEFDQHLLEADVLFAPIRLETNFHTSEEIYGKTKVSGSVNEAIRFQKVILIHEDYRFPENENHLRLPYGDVASCVTQLERTIKREVLVTSENDHSEYLRENQLSILKEGINRITQ